jgi:hypothetical protein
MATAAQQWRWQWWWQRSDGGAAMVEAVQRWWWTEAIVEYQSKTIRGTKYVSYDAQLCPVIAKGLRAPNAQLTHQIVDRHHEEL